MSTTEPREPREPVELDKATIVRLVYEGDGRSRDVQWDNKDKGLGVRIYPSGRKAFVLSYRRGRRKRLLTLGEFGPLTVQKARKLAILEKGNVIEGGDPVAERKAAAKRGNVREFAETYLDQHARDRKKPASIEADERHIRNHINPIIGGLMVDEVTRSDIEDLKRAVKNGKTARPRPEDQRGGAAVTGGPIVANRVLALASKMFNCAEKWGVRPDGSNPCRHVDRYKEGQRERFLSEAELATLGDVLAKAADEGESIYAVAAIRMLIFTGARVSEITGLRWEHVDVERVMLRLPDSKSGRKSIYLNAPALETLANLPRVEGNPYVIVSERDGGPVDNRKRHASTEAPLVNLQKPWQRIRKRAGLEGVRLHDLRHSFASVGAAGGASLPIIGKLLGHAKTATTERYAHLSADPLRAANEAIGQRIAAAMTRNNGSGEVVKIGQRA